MREVTVLNFIEQKDEEARIANERGANPPLPRSTHIVKFFGHIFPFILDGVPRHCLVIFNS